MHYNISIHVSDFRSLSTKGLFFLFKWIFWKKNAAGHPLVIQNFEKNGIKVAIVNKEK